MSLPERFAPFNYSKWVEDAENFSKGLARAFDLDVSILIEPKLTSLEVNRLQELCGKPMPTALLEFLEEGCGGLDISYSWEIEVDDSVALANLSEIFGYSRSDLWGGGAFCFASSLVDYQLKVQEWAHNTWVAEDPDEFAKWNKAIPIMEMPNGDFLSLDGRESNANPRVLYLAHDDVSPVIAKSFTTFLNDWAKVCFVGPEYWMLEPFLSREGLLDSGGNKARQLRSLLLN